MNRYNPYFSSSSSSSFSSPALTLRKILMQNAYNMDLYNKNKENEEIKNENEDSNENSGDVNRTDGICRVDFPPGRGWPCKKL